MPLTWVGFNFRSTLGYVTDGVGEIDVLGSAADGYPQTALGWTFGWEDSVSAADRDSGIDRRLAGINFTSNVPGVQKRFRVDLPAPGPYQVRLALGDTGSAQADQYCDFLDTDKLILTRDHIGDGTSTGFEFIDAMGYKYDEDVWPSANKPVTLPFATTILRLRIGTPTVELNSTTIAHLMIGRLSVAVPTWRGPGATRASRFRR